MPRPSLVSPASSTPVLSAAHPPRATPRRPFRCSWSRRARRVGAVVGLTVLLAGTVSPSAEAADATKTTTGSCMDAGGMTWHTKVVWGATYATSAGTRKVSVDYAGWTSTLGRVATDSTVTTYDAAGRGVGSLTRTATLDYQQGTVDDSRNPVNPPVGGTITIRVGRDADGAADCTVTHRQTTADPVVAAVGDMVCPPGSLVTPATCQQQAVSDSILAARPASLLTLGDNVYNEGTPAQFRDAYHPSYGR